MKSFSLNTEESARMNTIWQLYVQLQEAIRSIDVTASVDLVKQMHEVLSLMSNGTEKERKIMMEFELQILPSYIQEICELSESISSFIQGRQIADI